MPYIVKYIGYACNNKIDISVLYKQEVLKGYKVVLVCESENAQCVYLKDIALAKLVDDIYNINESVVLMTTDNDAKLFAVQIAFALSAQQCDIYTENTGFFTVDPSTTNFGVKLNKIDYDEVMEMVCSGYKVVSLPMLELAKKSGVILNLLSYLQPDAEGTLVKEVLASDGYVVKGVIKDPNIAIITLIDIPDKKGVSYQIFEVIAKAGIVVDIILLPATNGKTQDISFTVNKADKLKVEKVLKEQQSYIGFKEIKVDDHVSKVSVIGAALQESFGIAATVFKVLYENDVDVKMINTSEIKIAVVVDKNDADTAVQKIHQAFIK